MMEHWRPIPGFEHYHISTGGRVKNVQTGVIRKPYVSGKGYLKIDLSRQGQRLKEYIHRLVLLAHHGDIPDGYQVHHKNANRQDNRLTNLQIQTAAGNAREAIQRRKNRQIKQLELFQEDYEENLESVRV